MNASEQILKWLKTPVVIILITCLGVVIYDNSLGNSFVGDDNVLIVLNSFVHSLNNIPIFFTSGSFSNGSKLIGNYYKPILTLVFALVYSVFGANPTAYHVLQLSIHIVNTTLVYLITKYFFRKEVALGIALIFLSHPINNEAVVYISGIQEPLFLLFGLLALVVIQKRTEIKYIKSIGVMILLLLSLLSKETGVVFLFISPIFQGLFRNKWRYGIIQSSIVFSIYLLMRLDIAGIYLNQNYIFPTTALTLTQKLVNLPQLIFFYLKTFFYPKDLIHAQSWLVKTMNFQSFYLPLTVDLIFFGTAVTIAFYLYQKNLQSFRTYFLFFIWLLLGLVVHSQVISLDQTVADRWFYSPIIGLLGMLGALVNLLDFKKIRNERIYLLILVSIVCLFSVRDIVRNANWSTPTTLYQHDLQVNSNSYQLQNLLGYELMNAGRLDEARYHIELSINQFPSYINWDGMGTILIKSNKFQEAKAAYSTSLTYWADDNAAYEGLSGIMVVNDDPNTAVNFIKSKALAKFPNDSLIWLYLAVAEYELGNKNEALQDAIHANQIFPSYESIKAYYDILNDQKQNFKEGKF